MGISPGGNVVLNHAEEDENSIATDDTHDDTKDVTEDEGDDEEGDDEGDDDEDNEEDDDDDDVPTDSDIWHLILSEVWQEWDNEYEERMEKLEEQGGLKIDTHPTATFI